MGTRIEQQRSEGESNKQQANDDELVRIIAQASDNYRAYIEITESLESLNNKDEELLELGNRDWHHPVTINLTSV